MSREINEKQLLKDYEFVDYGKTNSNKAFRKTFRRKVKRSSKHYQKIEINEIANDYLSDKY